MNSLNIPSSDFFFYKSDAIYANIDVMNNISKIFS